MIEVTGKTYNNCYKKQILIQIHTWFILDIIYFNVGHTGDGQMDISISMVALDKDLV